MRTSRPSALIESAEQLGTLLNRAFAEESDELLAAAESVQYAVLSGQAEWPINLDFPDPPDARIVWRTGCLAVEATKLTGQVGMQVMQEARRLATAGKRPLVEDERVLYEQRKAKCRQGIERSGDFQSIKFAGEKLTGAGYVAGERATIFIDLVEYALRTKGKKHDVYRKCADRVWLFLIDQGSFEAFRDILTNEELLSRLRMICEASRFDAILYYRWHDGVRDLKSL